MPQVIYARVVEPPRGVETFPSLISSTDLKKIQRIPYPGDFDLEKFVYAVMDRYVPDTFEHERDAFVRKDAIPTLMSDILLSPEQDPCAIQSRQEVLEYVTSHEELRRFVTTTTIPPPSQKRYVGVYSGCRPSFMHNFKKGIYMADRDRAVAYRDFVQGLARAMPPATNGEIEQFRGHLTEVTTSKRFRELEDILGDETKPVKLRLDITYKKGIQQQKMRWGLSTSLPDSVEIEVTGASGKKLIFSDEFRKHDALPYGSREAFLPNYDSYAGRVGHVVDQFKQQTSRKLTRGNKPVMIRLELDQETGRAQCTVTYQRRKWGWVGSYETREQTVPVNYDALVKNEKGEDQFILNCVSPVRVETLDNFFVSYDHEIRALQKAAVELRYLTTVADYFNEMREDGFTITTPHINPAEKGTSMTRVIHPLLAEQKKPEEIVANDFSTTPDVNVTIISGPNANAKTVYEDSLIFAQLMTQAGWYVFAREVHTAPADTIYTQRIQKGDIVAGQSRHTKELGRTRYIAEHATPRSWIVVDEPYSGTKPDDGATLGIALTKAMGHLGATTIISSHYERIAEFAEGQPYARNVQAEMDKETMKPTYRIVPGKSTISNGVYLASEMGVDERGLMKILEERAGNGEFALRRAS